MLIIMGFDIATKILPIYIEFFWKLENQHSNVKMETIVETFSCILFICTDIDFGWQAMLA